MEWSSLAVTKSNTRASWCGVTVGKEDHTGVFQYGTNRACVVGNCDKVALCAFHPLKGRNGDVRQVSQIFLRHIGQGPGRSDLVPCQRILIHWYHFDLKVLTLSSN